MAVVRLGNPRAVVSGSRVPLGEQVTTITVPDSYTTDEMLRTITHADGVWSQHSDAAGPSWVESDYDDLAWLLSKFYGCPVGRPETEEGESDEG